jgi:hypothetical protein
MCMVDMALAWPVNVWGGGVGGGGDKTGGRGGAAGAGGGGGGAGAGGRGGPGRQNGGASGEVECCVVAHSTLYIKGLRFL